MAVSRSPSSFPSTRVKQAPELSLKANPNLACGTVVLYRFIQIFNRFDEIRLNHNDFGIGRKFHADRFDAKQSSPALRCEG